MYGTILALRGSSSPHQRANSIVDLLTDPPGWPHIAAETNLSNAIWNDCELMGKWTYKRFCLNEAAMVDADCSPSSERG